MMVKWEEQPSISSYKSHDPVDMIQENKPIRIYLIDDQAMIRAAFKSLIEEEGDFKVVGSNGDPRQGVQEIKELKPDLLILDIAMPGLSGLDVVPLVKRACPRTKVLMASQHEASKFVQQALQAGADGYLSKDSDPGELRLAIASIYRGESYLSPKVAGAVLGQLRSHHEESEDDMHSRLDCLTPREREVFQLIAIGKANKEIAAQLNLSLGTIKKHRENLQRKLDCHSAAEIARLAIQEGLLNL